MCLFVNLFERECVTVSSFVCQCICVFVCKFVSVSVSRKIEKLL